MDFIGVKAQYDDYAQYIWGVRANGELQMLADLRGWGAIQNLFMIEGGGGQIDVTAAIKFQHDLGEWIVDAINEKLEKDRKEGKK